MLGKPCLLWLIFLSSIHLGIRDVRGEEFKKFSFYGIGMGDKIQSYPFFELTEIQDIFGMVKIYEFNGKLKKFIVNTKNDRITMVNVTREFDNPEISQALFEVLQKELEPFLEHHEGTILHQDARRIEAKAKKYRLSLIHEKAMERTRKPWIAFLCRSE